MDFYTESWRRPGNGEKSLVIHRFHRDGIDLVRHGFRSLSHNDLPYEIVVTRYKDYYAYKQNPERQEIKVVAQSSMCLFAFFGPMDAESAGDPESIYELPVQFDHRNRHTRNQSNSFSRSS